MSMYVKVETQFRDIPALLVALSDLCPKWAPYLLWSDESRPMYGYHGDLRPERANIVIPRSVVGGASNDIGFAKDENGQIVATISEYDQRSGGYGQPWMVSLKKQYAYRVVQRDQSRRGRTVRMERCAKTGKDQLVIEGIR